MKSKQHTSANPASLGPWATMLEVGTTASLSAFWRKRMARLPEAQAASPRVAWPLRLALAGLGKPTDAQAERERMEAIYRHVPETEMLMNNSARNVIAVGMADLDARIARAKGDGEAEIAHWNRAVELQDHLNYMEPPEWHYPVREALGGALLRRGKAAEAEMVFRKDLELNPRNGRSLFGLLQALKAQRKPVSVDWVKKEFSEAWKYSQTQLKVENL